LIVMLELLQKSDIPSLPVIVTGDDPKFRDAFDRVRCPKCEWVPTS